MSDGTSPSKKNPILSPSATASKTFTGFPIPARHPLGCFVFKGLFQSFAGI